MSGFWNNNEYAQRDYIGRKITEEMIKSIQVRLGYTLPASYIELLRFQNGGTPFRTNHKTEEATSWAPDHIAITGIFGIDDEKRCSLGGFNGSQFWIEHWKYPDIGIYFSDCPSAGHDMLCLDYRQCGPNGEPQVVHVDQEFDYQITYVAPSFESFIKNLEPDEAFE